MKKTEFERIIEKFKCKKQGKWFDDPALFKNERKVRELEAYLNKNKFPYNYASLVFPTKEKIAFVPTGFRTRKFILYKNLPDLQKNTWVRNDEERETIGLYLEELEIYITNFAKKELDEDFDASLLPILEKIKFDTNNQME